MVGNIPNFTRIDTLRCFLRFSKNAGRQELAKELELGEGTIRSILEILKSKKLIDSTKKGHFLSRRGKDALSRICGCISIPKKMASQDIYPHLKKMGVVVKNMQNLREIYKLRDTAVKNGADGALILRFDGKLYALESDYGQDYTELEKYFDFEDNDILAVAFSGKKRHAENGALAIAVELSDALKKFISGF